MRPLGPQGCNRVQWCNDQSISLHHFCLQLMSHWSQRCSTSMTSFYNYYLCRRCLDVSDRASKGNECIYMYTRTQLSKLAPFDLSRLTESKYTCPSVCTLVCTWGVFGPHPVDGQMHGYSDRVQYYHICVLQHIRHWSRHSQNNHEQSSDFLVR